MKYQYKKSQRFKKLIIDYFAKIEIKTLYRYKKRNKLTMYQGNFDEIEINAKFFLYKFSFYLSTFIYRTTLILRQHCEVFLYLFTNV